MLGLVEDDATPVDAGERLLVAGDEGVGRDDEVTLADLRDELSKLLGLKPGASTHSLLALPAAAALALRRMSGPRHFTARLGHAVEASLSLDRAAALGLTFGARLAFLPLRLPLQ